MAYVGTPRYLGSDIDTLASILQGEAGGEGLRGLQAVASVIQNRAKQNFSGYGSSLASQALARNQFQGQSSNPSAEARQVAQALVGGQLPDVTGGALYYANPGASTAAWARRLNDTNALKIGNHYFTNNADGQPFLGVNTTPGTIGGDSMVARNFDAQTAPATNTPTGPLSQKIFGSMAPSTGSIASSGIDPDIAALAYPGEKKSLGDRLSKAGKAFDENMPQPPRVSGGGDARQSGNMLLSALSDKDKLMQMFLNRRLGTV